VARELWARCDELLSTDGALAEAFDAIIEFEEHVKATDQHRRADLSIRDLDDTVTVLQHLVPVLDEVLTLLERLEAVTASLYLTTKRQRWPLRYRLRRAEKGAQDVLERLLDASRRSTPRSVDEGPG
jgi:hypothetical protein